MRRRLPRGLSTSSDHTRRSWSWVRIRPRPFATHSLSHGLCVRLLPVPPLLPRYRPPLSTLSTGEITLSNSVSQAGPNLPASRRASHATLRSHHPRDAFLLPGSSQRRVRHLFLDLCVWDCVSPHLCDEGKLRQSREGPSRPRQAQGHRLCAHGHGSGMPPSLLRQTPSSPPTTRKSCPAKTESRAHNSNAAQLT